MIGDYAIVPVREFAATKLRLRDDLSREQRVSLTSTLLKRVVRAIERSQIERTVIVASDTSEVSSYLQEFSKITVVSEDSYHNGVNKAMNTGIDFAVRKGARTIALLPSDLPLITHSKIDDAVNLLQEYELVMNPSLKRDGTNLLAMKSSLKFQLHYDDDSFVKHLAEARRRHLNFQLLDWQEFSIDLDDASDLKRTMEFYKSRSFDDFLDNVSTREI
jgi:2-phospho-L-lactate/phosphoenolpyruvate guanylyltransferase